MVYAMLLTALATVSAVEGALVMLAFGLGTLPNVILIAMFLKRMRGMLASPMARYVTGTVIPVDGGWSLGGTSISASGMKQALLAPPKK